jgi:hypothetical protein
MKKYEIIYQAKVTVLVEASSEQSALNKAQKATLKASKEDGIYLEPIGTEFKFNEIE